MRHRKSLLLALIMLSGGCSDDSGPGQLDTGPVGDLALHDGPGTVDGPKGLRWTAVTAGGAHTCALRSDDTAWCWGSNSNGQLGNGTSTPSPHPIQVKGLTGVTDIDADWVHTCAATSAGKAHCWGENDGMQLGDPNAETTYPSCVPGGCPLPVLVVNLDAVAAVGTGARHSCAVLSTGQAWCWGFNEFGQLGNGNMPTDSAAPAQVKSLSNVVEISGSPWHTCAVTQDNKAYCWGDNADGNLGVEDPMESDLPIAVPGVPNVTRVVAGEVHTCALTQGGRVFCFGANAAGQLGSGTTDASTTPLEVSGFSGARAVTTALDHSCAVDGQGAVWCWGSNGSDDNNDGVPDEPNGKVGKPTSVKNQLKPAVVAGVTHAAEVSAGDQHTCAVTHDGEIWCWGDNTDGQLGSGTGPDSPTPLKVPVPQK